MESSRVSGKTSMNDELDKGRNNYSNDVVSLFEMIRRRL